MIAIVGLGMTLRPLASAFPSWKTPFLFVSFHFTHTPLLTQLLAGKRVNEMKRNPWGRLSETKPRIEKRLGYSSDQRTTDNERKRKILTAAFRF
jgi:hypothetical protein